VGGLCKPFIRGCRSKVEGMAASTAKVPKTAGRKKFAVAHGIKLPLGRKPKATIQKKAAAAPKAPRKATGSTARTPYEGFSKPSGKEVKALHQKLAVAFGERRPTGRNRRDILDTVVGTILSQNTTNTNSHAAFTKLKAKFKTWDKVCNADPSEVEEAIRCGGLAPTKTKYIQEMCRKIHEERGKVSLEFLRKESKEGVHAYLGKFTGVGKKTVAIINLFDVGHPDMAVDTHVFRYAIQLGWVPTAKQIAAHNGLAGKPGSGLKRWPIITRDSVYAHLDATFPDQLKYSMHLILTDTEGGLPVVCKAQNHLSFPDEKVIRVDGQALRPL